MHGYVLRGGVPLWIYRWVDGALLVDLWPELDLPTPLRKEWQPLIDHARQGPAEDSMRGSFDDTKMRRARELQERIAALRVEAARRLEQREA